MLSQTLLQKWAIKIHNKTLQSQQIKPGKEIRNMELASKITDP